MEQKKKKLKEGAEDENNFFAHHLEHLNELDQKELRNQQLKKEKYLKEKELRDNLLRISLERKAKEKEKEKMNDQNYIENVKKGLIMDEELIKSKKEKNKLFIREIMDDMDKKIEEKNINKEMDKIQSKKQFDDYFKNLEQKEIERDEKAKMFKEKVKSEMNRYDHYPNIKQIEKSQHQLEIEKYEQESRMIEKSYFEKLKNEKKKKNSLQKEMVITLNKQLEEKKTKIKSEKFKEAILGKEINNDVEEYKRMKIVKENNMKSTYFNYKEDLKKQFDEANKLKNSFDERERLLSKKLIKHIKSSPLLVNFEEV